MLDFERLRVLHAVWLTGSVGVAAQDLHVTASAVSQQMARLEREAGQRLTERSGRGIRLTEAGVLLAREAGDLLAHAEQVEARLAGHRGVVAGRLAVAAFATAARGLLPGAVRELRSRYPDLSVSVSEQEPHEAIPALTRGDLDVAVVQEWPDTPLAVCGGLARRDLLEDVFDVALPPGHRLAGRDRVTMAELADDGWIGWSAGQICHDWLVRTLREHGAQPRIRHTASEHSTQLALVAAGLGAAIIPRLGREPAPASVRFVPLDPAPVRQVYALWRSSSTPRPAIGAALDALCGQAGQRGEERSTGARPAQSVRGGA
jgi:DNA-binding transcriptional LysR family regulator